jgi:uncharacterized protein
MPAAPSLRAARGDGTPGTGTQLRRGDHPRPGGRAEDEGRIPVISSTRFAGPGFPRAAVVAHPVAAFLVLVFAVTGLLAVLPFSGVLYGPAENILGAAVPAFVLTAIAGGRAAVRDLAGRALRWRVRPRWYVVALAALPVALVVVAPALYGTPPLRALAEHWPEIVTSFLPLLVLMAVFNNVAEEVGWTGFLFHRLQGRHRPAVAALLTFAPFWLWHLLSFVNDTGSWLLGGAFAGLLLLPLLATRFVIGWLYNASGASVLVAGLFHATHNATVNPGGLAVAVLGLPAEEVVVVTGALVVIAAVVVVVATRGRLGLPDRVNGARAVGHGRSSTSAPSEEGSAG